jgi:gamma-glutamyltranspeptidase/glutathione hydrolase
MRIFEETWSHGLALGETKTVNIFNPEGIEKALAEFSVEKAEQLWPQVKSGPSRPINGVHLDTCAIVVIDESGMIAHGTHSTSSVPFGAGFMVDGVVVTRPAHYFASINQKMPVGLGTSLLALKDGRPIFVAGSPSISTVQNVLQNTMNVMNWGMEAGESVMQPMFGSPIYPSKRPMVEATMGDKVIADVEKRGLKVARVSPWEPEMGSCQSIRIAADGKLHGAADPRRLGRAAGL